MRRRDFLAAGLALSAAPLLSVKEQPEPRPLQLAVIGTGSRGTYLLHVLLRMPGISFPALCDIDGAHLSRAQSIVKEAGGKRPDGYGERGEHDYRRMLERDDLDGLLIATPVGWHAEMAVDAMSAGIPTSCEVVAATTIDDCWKVVETHEKTGVPYMTLENYVYTRPAMMVQNMVDKGVFGELTSAECGYIHELPFSMLWDGVKLTWRGKSRLTPSGNHYPTHSLGPVCGWMGIHRGDRLARLTSMSSPSAARASYVREHYPEGHPVRDVKWKTGDNNMTLIQTAKGRLITLRFDTDSPRPHNMTHYALQGTRASYHSSGDGFTGDQVYIVGRSPESRWERLDAYRSEYDHPWWAWKTKAEEAEKSGAQSIDAMSSATLRSWGTGHGGGDFVELWTWVRSLREKTPTTLSVYDAVAWASVMPLSEQSVAEGGAPMEIPDFTRGGWATG